MVFSAVCYSYQAGCSVWNWFIGETTASIFRFSLLFFSLFFFYYGTIPEALPNATLMILENEHRAYISLCAHLVYSHLYCGKTR